MPLLNYTTTIEASKTINEIQVILASHGAKSIMINYSDNGEIESLSFLVITAHGPANIRLPVEPEAILKILQRDMKVPRSMVNRTQAIRIAWRIIKDWVAAQMALVETDMVKMEQVFLPYVLSRDGQTLFQVFESRNLLTQGDNEG